jgi:hypothetical protein
MVITALCFVAIGLLAIKKSESFSPLLVPGARKNSSDGHSRRPAVITLAAQKAAERTVGLDAITQIDLLAVFRPMRNRGFEGANGSLL